MTVYKLIFCSYCPFNSNFVNVHKHVCLEELASNFVCVFFLLNVSYKHYTEFLCWHFVFFFSEYYFSSDNLQRDFFLRRKMDKEGYIPISLVASFHRVQALTQDVALIIKVLCFEFLWSYTIHVCLALFHLIIRLLLVDSVLFMHYAYLCNLFFTNDFR